MNKNKINMFLDDSKAVTGSLFSIKLHTMKFTDYKIITLPKLHRKIGNTEHIKENVAVIAGVFPIITSNAPERLMGIELEEFHTVDFNSNCFFDVINTVRDIDILNSPDMGQSIPTDKILDLCKKYGIRHDNDIQKQYNRVFGLEVEHFKYRLYRLYWCFVIYAAISEEDHYFLAKNIPEIKWKNITDKKLILEYAKEWLALHLGNIKVNLAPSTAGFTIKSEALDLIEACSIFISLVAASISTQAGNKINYQNCRNCGDFFSDHGNKKYCAKCDRRTVWASKKRNERPASASKQ